MATWCCGDVTSARRSWAGTGSKNEQLPRIPAGLPGPLERKQSLRKILHPGITKRAWLDSGCKYLHWKKIQWKLPFFYWIPIFIIKEEDCQNIWQKKNMNDRQCKDSLAFFLSECELHLTGHLNFWVKESSFLIFTSVCVFTDFLRSAWRLK